jgi:tripartite-type tricarboxylate transporter receptor subunit TctC
MQWDMRSRLAIAFCAGIFLALAGTATWPQSGRTIRLILPFPPGGPADAMARLVAEQIGASGGPTMVVESHPGAGTEIGTEYVSRAEPDGHTLGIISNSFVVLPHLRKLNYDPLTDFAPICELASFPPLIVVNSMSPYRTFADLIDAARKQPSVLTYATLGPATASQMAFEMLKRATKANFTFVPYPGYTPAVQALLGDQVTVAQADLATLQGQIQTGKLRALVTMARRRIDLLPDVPTIAEAGYADAEAEFFGGVIAPVKTPKEMIAKLTDLFTAAIRAPGVKTKFSTLGFFSGGECGADFAAILHKNYADYRRIIHDVNFKME